MTTQASKIERVTGRAVPVRGDDIDTDRIIPARFLKTITFEGLEDHVFEDDRQQLATRGITHVFDNPAHKGATLLFAQANFGCGSSREHAPRAIARWGIGAIVAESYAEIFFGNSLMIGLPCVTAAHEDIERLLEKAEASPETEFTLDLDARRITGGGLSLPVMLPDETRSALLSGDWDATALLLDHYEQVEQTAARLPYMGSGLESRRF
jgi:3-isopropylmalate/(R)-2-methylmalate dehydratase small subunit